MYDLSPVLCAKVTLSKQSCVLVLLCITLVQEGKGNTSSLLITLAVAKIPSLGRAPSSPNNKPRLWFLQSSPGEPMSIPGLLTEHKGEVTFGSLGECYPQMSSWKVFTQDR